MVGPGKDDTVNNLPGDSSRSNLFPQSLLSPPDTKGQPTSSMGVISFKPGDILQQVQFVILNDRRRPGSGWYPQQPRSHDGGCPCAVPLPGRGHRETSSVVPQQMLFYLGWPEGLRKSRVLREGEGRLSTHPVNTQAWLASTSILWVPVARAESSTYHATLQKGLEYP